jgi:hypothetical protein
MKKFFLVTAFFLAFMGSCNLVFPDNRAFYVFRGENQIIAIAGILLVLSGLLAIAYAILDLKDKK